MSRTRWMILCLMLAAVGGAWLLPDPPPPARTVRVDLSIPPPQVEDPLSEMPVGLRFAELGSGAPFDPATCPPGHGAFVYWAVGEQLFRFPYDPQRPLFSRAARRARGETVPGFESVRAAAAPQLPEGCRGNPLRAGSAPYMQAYSRALFHRQFGRWSRSPASAGGAQPWLRESADSDMYRRWFATLGVCRSPVPGLVECMRSLQPYPWPPQYSHVIRIDGGLISSPRFRIADVHAHYQADIASTVGFGSVVGQNGLLLKSQSDLVPGVLRLRVEERIYPGELDRLAPYYRGLVEYLDRALVEG
ncbi:MAG TPA: hypothetical protein VLI06_19085 [Solimonas sp.]|nr:hypothetical protein [Solimonas sp.]